MSAVAPAPMASNKATNSPGGNRNRNSRKAVPAEAPDLPSSEAPSSSSPPPVLDDPILQAIARKAPGVLQQQQVAVATPLVTLTLYIPTSAVGAVIGRRGQNIAQLQKMAAATTGQPVRVSVVGAMTPSSTETTATTTSATTTEAHSLDSTTTSNGGNHSIMTGSTTTAPPFTYTELDYTNPHWTPVVIRGDAVATLTAAAALHATPTVVVDQVVLDVPLARSKHAAVVGKRGHTVATLSAEYKVRIMVPNKELRHDMIQLEGDLVPVKACLAAILAVCAKKDEAVTITVATCPSQTKLRSVSRKTDCIIKKKRIQEGHWQLQVTGPADQIQGAVTLLSKWNEEYNTTNATTMSNNNEAVGDATGPPGTQSSSSPRRKGRSGGGNRQGGGGGRGAVKKKTKPGEASS